MPRPPPRSTLFPYTTLFRSLPDRFSRHHRYQARGELHACECKRSASRSEEHTSELQSLRHLVCRLLLEKKKRSTSDGNGSSRESSKRPRPACKTPKSAAGTS